MEYQKWAKVMPERGYGSEPFMILKETDNEYILSGRVEGKEQSFEIYKHHCYVDSDCIRKNIASRDRQKQVNTQIGL